MPRLPLPWNRTIDHHKSIRYAEVKERITDPFAVRREADGTQVKFVASGVCPACGGRMTKEFPYGVIGSKGIRKSSAAVVPPTAPMFCECGHVHPGRPAGATDDGCGRYWDIDLTAS